MQETPEGFGVDELDGQTMVHPLGLAALLLFGLAMLVVPRKYAVWPLIFMACCIAPAQRFAIFSLNFHFLRIMLLFATARIVCRGEASKLRLIALDWVVLAHAICGSVIYMLQYQSLDAVIAKMGSSYDALGTYFAFRCLVRSWDDVHSLILGFLVTSIPVTIGFVIESKTGRNVFAFLGGVPEFTEVREGRLRCQGAFSHPILAGCFWASMLPMIVARWFAPGKSKFTTLIGTICCLMLVALSASSTPIMAVLFGVVAACVYPLRKYMSAMRWGGLATLLILHFFILKGPVWSLLAKVNILGGSTGWHRFHLVDEAINHFPEWWLFGTRDTSHWGWGLWDITNQFVMEGTRGGVLTMLLFISIIVVTFAYVGIIVRANSDKSRSPTRIMAWAIGTATFVNVCSYFAVSYFGQISILTWLGAALIASIISYGDRPGRVATGAPAFPMTSTLPSMAGKTAVHSRYV